MGEVSHGDVCHVAGYVDEHEEWRKFFALPIEEQKKKKPWLFEERPIKMSSKIECHKECWR